ncbi:hypothetical protein [Kitasatospora sp. NPDC096140]
MFHTAASIATTGLAALMQPAAAQTASAATSAGSRTDTAISSQVIGWN